VTITPPTRRGPVGPAGRDGPSGYSVETTSTITVSGQKDGGFTPTGTPKTDAKLRANGASAAEEPTGEPLPAAVRLPRAPVPSS
jgi:hypothetical protein